MFDFNKNIKKFDFNKEIINQKNVDEGFLDGMMDDLNQLNNLNNNKEDEFSEINNDVYDNHNIDLQFDKIGNVFYFDKEDKKIKNIFKKADDKYPEEFINKIHDEKINLIGIVVLKNVIMSLVNIPKILNNKEVTQEKIKNFGINKKYIFFKKGSWELPSVDIFKKIITNEENFKLIYKNNLDLFNISKYQTSPPFFYFPTGYYSSYNNNNDDRDDILTLFTNETIIKNIYQEKKNRFKKNKNFDEDIFERTAKKWNWEDKDKEFNVVINFYNFKSEQNSDKTLSEEEYFDKLNIQHRKINGKCNARAFYFIK